MLGGGDGAQACTCAERREVNKALTGENSIFTRRGRSSERGGTMTESRFRAQSAAAAMAAAARTAESDVEMADPHQTRHESTAEPFREGLDDFP